LLSFEENKFGNKQLKKTIFILIFTRFPKIKQASCRSQRNEDKVLPKLSAKRGETLSQVSSAHFLLFHAKTEICCEGACLLMLKKLSNLISFA
jgi:hypothetical protein